MAAEKGAWQNRKWSKSGRLSLLRGLSSAPKALSYGKKIEIAKKQKLRKVKYIAQSAT